MTNASNEVSPIIQHRLDSLTEAVGCLQTQRNAALDSLTDAQVAKALLERGSAKLRQQIEELNKQIVHLTAQKENWRERYDDMTLRKDALAWYIQQLLIEIPEAPEVTIDKEVLSVIVQNYQAHLNGELLKVNALKVHEVLQREAQEAAESEQKDDPAVVNIKSKSIKEEVEVVLEQSLAKKLDNAPVIEDAKEASDKDAGKDAQRKVKS